MIMIMDVPMILGMVTEETTVGRIFIFLPVEKLCISSRTLLSFIARRHIARDTTRNTLMISNGKHISDGEKQTSKT